VHKLTVLSFFPPACIAHLGAILLHDYWTVYDSPSDLPFVCCTPYNIGKNNIVYRPINSRYGNYRRRPLTPPRMLLDRAGIGARSQHVEYAECGNEYGILFTFSLISESSTPEYGRIYVINRV